MRSYRKIALHRRVVVNLTTGSAVEAVLWDERGPLLVLRDATLLEEGVAPVKVDGEVVVDRAKIAFVQVVA